MEIDLDGLDAAIIGERHGVAETVFDRLAANGARTAWVDSQNPDPVDILIVSHGLRVEIPANGDAVLSRGAAVFARRMAERGRGRIVFLLSALGAVPMRRHADYSACMAGMVATMRALAMQWGPQVLVNAVGVGLVQEGDLVAGDARMLSHIPLARPGSAMDAANAALFLCDPLNSYMTGQMLVVDGGWTAGYGRDF